ncbi:hypothetical protein [Lactococcus petauri]|uniref:hypothetical protein n=1 Tax=Lactococcus petauri TaxID=1940789 RepID=UPI0021D51C0F|nr:hypothetical protein [Lactococcus petauri]MCU7363640.1 hypothetical protein [Lactococcus petauri]MDA3734908.1 hypothetical protein [Lactococcus petauri]MDC7842339.1 hypothetical protein [Lactococcus petauri]
MLDRPKGHEYWIYTDDDIKLKENSPDWARKELEDYKKNLEKEGNPKENGEIIQY